ncbi:MAG: hypothetical protein ACE5PV_26335 [Candidatus Poribacteria bacterium]
MCRTLLEASSGEDVVSAISTQTRQLVASSEMLQYTMEYGLEQEL